MSRLSLKQHRWGFTLVEQMIALGVTVITGLIVYVAFHAGVRLYASIFQVNLVHQTVRSGVDFIAAKVEEADEQPILLDSGGHAFPPTDCPTGPLCDSLKTVQENWVPSSGVRLRSPLAVRRLVKAMDATDDALELAWTPGTPATQAGDLISVAAPSVQAVVKAVSRGASSEFVTLLQPVGMLSLPIVTASTPNYIQAGAAISVSHYCSFQFVANGMTNRGELRYYPTYVDSSDPRFTDPQCYRTVAGNLRLTNDGDKPFSYTLNPTQQPYTVDQDYRALRVYFQIWLPDYRQVLGDSVNNQSTICTAMIWKSEMAQRRASSQGVPTPPPYIGPPPPPTPTPVATPTPVPTPPPIIAPD